MIYNYDFHLEILGFSTNHLRSLTEKNGFRDEGIGGRNKHKTGRKWGKKGGRRTLIEECYNKLDQIRQNEKGPSQSLKSLRIKQSMVNVFLTQCNVNCYFSAEAGMV